MGVQNIPLIQGLPFSLPEITNIADTLVWHKTAKWEQRSVGSIKRIIIHHTASESPLWNQSSYHVNTHGWAGLSYHLIISGGRINQVNELEDITFHAASNNTDSVAICIHGDLSKREMTSQERELLYGAILTVKSLCNIEQLLGHNEVNATSCPSTSVNKIRDDIQTIEYKMQQQDTWEAKLTKIAEMVNQFNYMNGLAKSGPSDGTAVWAVQQQLMLYDLMKQQKLL